MDKKEVERTVESNPGITFTMLREKLDAANGQLQYHLRNADVEQKGRGYVKKGGCESCELASYCTGKCIRRFLLEEDKKRILELVDEGVSKKYMAEKLSIAPSTLSYHLNDLKEKNALTNKDSVNPVLKKII